MRYRPAQLCGVVDGTSFEPLGIQNLVEEDFFAWVLNAPILHEATRRLRALSDQPAAQRAEGEEMPAVSIGDLMAALKASVEAAKRKSKARAGHGRRGLARTAARGCHTNDLPRTFGGIC